MPTPLATARQCLTPAAARALDDAAAVARRRSHPQTTSLHAVSALLSPTSSVLRDACVSSHGSSSASAYATTRTQLKALELCLSVSLDRQPATHRAGGPGSDGDPDPPVSNSLMAAIKRSQANQRRQPENFHLYLQMSSSSGQSSATASSSMACVKVELQHLILSILDDPVVSRVFSEAGFRSPEIKLAIVRPLPPHLLPYPRSPLFLYNQTDRAPDPNISNPGRRPFSFPFPGVLEHSGGDPDARRVGEALGAGRNPLLVGASAYGALRGFSEAVQGSRKTGGCGPLPMEMSGLSMVCVESEIQKFVSGPGSCDDQRLLSSRLEEVHRMARHCLGPALVINYGDLKDFVRGGGEAVGRVVGELTRFLKVYAGKVRLLGAAENYETCLKFFNLFPSIERDWDLQLLHIASLRASMPPKSCSRPSLMESFVPLGGFFSSPSNMNGPLRSSYQYLSRCQLCNEKCEKELTALSRGVLAGSVADQCQYSLPPWLQLVDKGLDLVQAKDDGMVFSEKVAGLQKKWDSICLHLHHTRPLPGADIYEEGSQVPVFVDFQFLKGMKENGDTLNSNNISISPNEEGSRRLFSCSSMDSQEMSITNQSVSFPVIPHAKNDDLLLNGSETDKPSSIDNSEPGGLGSPCSLSNPSICHFWTSHSSTASVATDLGLGISTYSSEESLKPTRPTSFELIMHGSSRCSSVSADLSKNDSNHWSAPSSCLGLNKKCWSDPTDPRDFKTLSKTLADRIGWQAEAITVISRTVANHWASNGKCHGTASLRGDIWFTFLGPDRFGKKKIAIALAEILFGSRENCICVDFGSRDGMMCTSPTFHPQDMNRYDPKSRGITIVDYIAGELRKKPLSIVFLENVDKADVLTQNCLSHAIRTSKFSDSHGREVGGNNAIFITTSRFNKSKMFPSPSEEATASYSEEKLLGVKSCSIQIVIGPSIGNCISNPMLLNKRKLMGENVTLGQHTLEVTKRAYNPSSNMLLDLNLPAEANDVHNVNEKSCSTGPVDSDIPISWLEEFFELVDETVFFKPFDFDAVATKLMDHARECFCSIVGLDCSLEIDSEIMEQMVAAACLSDRDRAVENWMDQTLGRGFTEAREMYNLTGDTVVKLVTCVGTPLDRQSPEVHLPAKIILNRSLQDA